MVNDNNVKVDCDYVADDGRNLLWHNEALFIL